jgi:riboflavin kinase, archaea type
MEIKGVIVSGTKKGAYFMSQSIYSAQFEDKLNFRPFIGTLNIQIEKSDVEKVRKLSESDLPKIKGGNNFGDVKFKKATLNINGEVKGAVIFPEKARHPTEVVEFIAPQNLKGTHHINDGDSITITIAD